MTEQSSLKTIGGSVQTRTSRHQSGENETATKGSHHGRRQKKLARTSVAASRYKQRGGIILILLLTLSVGILLVSFIFKSYVLKLYEMKVVGYERALNHLKAGMYVDSQRQFQIQKVMTIIEQYNPDMSSEKKYEIANEIYQMSVKYANLNVDLICATITHESALTWRPDIRSQVGAMGLMQIMPGTGVFLADDEGTPWTAPEEMLYNPIVNIRLGCRYLSTLISLYDLEGGLAAYNGGEKRAVRWLASGRDDRMLAEETRGYIPAVLKLYDEFRN